MEKPPFVDDISVKNALTGILIRSPVVSGILKEIITPKLPYNVSMVSAADIPGRKFCSVGQNSGQAASQIESGGDFSIPIFPEKELSWYGQPVAMLLGPDPERLGELSEQCQVLVEAADETQETGEEGEANPAGPEGGKKVIIERRYSTGPVMEAFEKADLIVEGRYNTGLEAPWPSDPLGAIAIPGPDGGITIHTSTQWPGHVCSSVAQCLGIKGSQVEVEVSRLEIHLDGKIWAPSLLACQASVGARQRNKPVRLILKRDEDFLFSPKSAGSEIFLESALNKQGAILGTRLKITVDFGAHGIFAREILDRSALSALGAYSHGSIDLEGQGITSQIPPAVPTAGFGLVQGFFAAERHASKIADSLGIDPAEWRKNFFLRKGRKLPIGIDLKNPPLEELIDSVEAMGDYRRKWAAYELLRKNRREAASAENLSYEALRGIGLSLAYQGNSLLYDHRAPKAPEEGVELTLEKDGTLEIRTALPWGDNQLSVWREIASKTLGVETVRIVTKAEAPKTVPESGPACLSRSINIITELVEKACIAIRKQRFRDPLPITVHRYYRSSRVQPWADNQQARPKGTGYVGPEGYGLYAGLEEKIDENALGCLSWGAAVVEVVVDTATYLPFVRGIWLSIDGGTIQSEERAKKSICASATQALSWAMQEDVQYENGRIDPRRVRDYPVLPDYSPPITVDFLWSEGKSRGIGELPFALIPAAFAQALSQAMDCHFCHYPITSPDIWKAAQQFSAGAGP